MTEQIAEAREIIDWMRDLVDNQTEGSSVVLVQREKFNRIVGVLASLAAYRVHVGQNSERVQALTEAAKIADEFPNMGGYSGREIASVIRALAKTQP